MAGTPKREEGRACGYKGEEPAPERMHLNGRRACAFARACARRMHEAAAAACVRGAGEAACCGRFAGTRTQGRKAVTKMCVWCVRCHVRLFIAAIRDNR